MHFRMLSAICFTLDQSKIMSSGNELMYIFQQRAITEEQLKMSIRDKKENLVLLSKAYEDNKISQDLYKVIINFVCW